MNYLKVLPGSRREPPGLERLVLRKLPVIALAGTLIALFFAVFSHMFPPVGHATDVTRHLQFVDMLVIAMVLTHWTAILTAAIGCIVVVIMKGPGYVADQYELHDSERPRDH